MSRSHRRVLPVGGGYPRLRLIWGHDHATTRRMFAPRACCVEVPATRAARPHPRTAIANVGRLCPFLGSNASPERRFSPERGVAVLWLARRDLAASFPPALPPATGVRSTRCGGAIPRSAPPTFGGESWEGEGCVGQVERGRGGGEGGGKQWQACPAP